MEPDKLAFGFGNVGMAETARLFRIFCGDLG
jgi:hypothetical protein